MAAEKPPVPVQSHVCLGCYCPGAFEIVPATPLPAPAPDSGDQTSSTLSVASALTSSLEQSRTRVVVVAFLDLIVASLSLAFLLYRLDQLLSLEPDPSPQPSVYLDFYPLMLLNALLSLLYLLGISLLIPSVLHSTLPCSARPPVDPRIIRRLLCWRTYNFFLILLLFLVALLHVGHGRINLDLVVVAWMAFRVAPVYIATVRVRNLKKAVNATTVRVAAVNTRI